MLRSNGMGCLLFIGGFFAGLLSGVIVAGVALKLTGSDKISAAFGNAAFMLTGSIVISYEPVLFKNPQKLAEIPKLKSSWERRESMRVRGTAIIAPWTMSFAFSIIGVTASIYANGPIWVVVLATVATWLLGWFVGSDVKQRYLSICEEYRRAVASEFATEADAGNFVENR